MGGEAAAPTGELGLRGAIPLIDVAALRAFAGRIARVHLDHAHPRECCLIEQEHLQLEKRPAMQNDPLPVPNDYPFADPGQVFDRDPASGALSRGDDLLCDDMIGVGGEPLFFARQFLQAAFRRGGSVLLELLPQAPLPETDSFHRRAAVEGSVRIGGDIRNAQVDAQELIHIEGNRLFDVARRYQVPAAPMEEQIRFALVDSEERQLPVSRRERNLEAAVQGSDRNGLFGDMPAQIAVVEGERTERLKDARDLLVQLVGVRHFRNTTNSDLRRNLESLPGVGVVCLVDPVLPKLATFKSARSASCRPRSRCAAIAQGLLPARHRATTSLWRRASNGYCASSME